MNTAKNRKTQRTDKCKLQSTNASGVLNPAILPLEELRQLVFEIILRGDIETFLRQMVILWDSFKAGQIDKLTQITSQSKDPAFAKLMSALSAAIQEGELVAARLTVFLAASYAYQEGLDYFWELTRYLDKFRQDNDQ